MKQSQKSQTDTSIDLEENARRAGDAAMEKLLAKYKQKQRRLQNKR